ncbi:hypothetical protein GGI25_000850 [Coemansia spiralis]|uniref:Uncharacterized protein n=2 Tax=Coemansia TaxID=4863 RepID=A0A9W8KZ09_9FUNG|nr:hypothetical protein BX070DRAFT_223197 [Coemansia spiralis]KAJ1994113.1 hypothetical protein EDC05_001783 [Coemansia umbellata]KAJ2623587.1 hypothetical protein GGI26_002225 [Coemansia sp. RSA 1358]KAJ2680257.1 hypothetical protein GGI25_000850 [Coemansia spiralis]
MTAVNIPRLRVKPKKVKPLAKCAVEMSSLAACWATTSVDDRRCAESAKRLVTCIQKAKTPRAEKSDVNFHLARLGRQVLGK